METKTRKFADVDKSKFPFIIVTLKPIEPTKAEFLEHLAELTEIITNNKDFVLVLDISKSKFLPSELRIEAGNWTKRESETFIKNVKGFAFVNNSVVMAMIVKGVLLIAKPPIDYIVVKTMEEAIEWGSKKI